MGEILRVENYDIREAEVEHGRQPKAINKAVAALAQGVGAMVNGAVMELMEGLTHTTIKALRPADFAPLLRAYGLNLQHLVFKKDGEIRHAEGVPSSGWYMFRNVDRKIMAFVSDPLIIREDRKVTARIFVWKSPRLAS